MSRACATRSTGRSGDRRSTPCAGSDTGLATTRLPRASLRLRLTLAFAAGMTVVSFGVATFVYVQLRRDLDEAVDMGLRARAQVIVSSPSAMPPVGSLPR